MRFLTAAWPPVVFYIIAAMLTHFLGGVAAAGPCSPGAGIFLFILLIPVSAGLMLLNIYSAKTNPSRWINVAIHAAALIILLIIAS